MEKGSSIPAVNCLTRCRRRNDVNCNRMERHDSRTTFMDDFPDWPDSNYPAPTQLRLKERAHSNRALDHSSKPDRVCADRRVRLIGPTSLCISYDLLREFFSFFRSAILS